MQSEYKWPQRDDGTQLLGQAHFSFIKFFVLLNPYTRIWLAQMQLQANCRDEMHLLSRGQVLSLLQTVLRLLQKIFRHVRNQTMTEVPSLRSEAWLSRTEGGVFCPLCLLHRDTRTSSVHSVQRSCCSRSELFVQLSILHDTSQGQ